MIYQTEETRGNILRVAEALFLEQGFFTTQMKDVADAAGMSRNTLYRYFRDKADLGFAILDIAVGRVVLSFRAALARVERAGHANGREKLMAVLADVIVGGEHQTELRFMAEFDAYYSGERIAEGFGRRQDLSQWAPVENALESLAREGIADGSIRDDLDPAFLIWLILTTTRVLQREILTRGMAIAEPGDDRLRRLVPTVMTLLADGLRPRN